MNSPPSSSTPRRLPRVPARTTPAPSSPPAASKAAAAAATLPPDSRHVPLERKDAVSRKGSVARSQSSSIGSSTPQDLLERLIATHFEDLDASSLSVLASSNDYRVHTRRFREYLVALAVSLASQLDAVCDTGLLERLVAIPKADHFLLLDSLLEFFSLVVDATRNASYDRQRTVLSCTLRLLSQSIAAVPSQHCGPGQCLRVLKSVSLSFASTPELSQLFLSSDQLVLSPQSDALVRFVVEYIAHTDALGVLSRETVYQLMKNSLSGEHHGAALVAERLSASSSALCDRLCTALTHFFESTTLAQLATELFPPPPSHSASPRRRSSNNTHTTTSNNHSGESTPSSSQRSSIAREPCLAESLFSWCNRLVELLPSSHTLVTDFPTLFYSKVLHKSCRSAIYGSKPEVVACAIGRLELLFQHTSVRPFAFQLIRFLLHCPRRGQSVMVSDSTNDIASPSTRATSSASPASPPPSSSSLLHSPPPLQHSRSSAYEPVLDTIVSRVSSVNLPLASAALSLIATVLRLHSEDVLQVQLFAFFPTLLHIPSHLRQDESLLKPDVRTLATRQWLALCTAPRSTVPLIEPSTLPQTIDTARRRVIQTRCATRKWPNGLSDDPAEYLIGEADDHTASAARARTLDALPFTEGKLVCSLLNRLATACEQPPSVSRLVAECLFHLAELTHPVVRCYLLNPCATVLPSVRTPHSVVVTALRDATRSSPAPPPATCHAATDHLRSLESGRFLAQISYDDDLSPDTRTLFRAAGLHFYAWFALHMSAFTIAHATV